MKRHLIIIAAMAMCLTAAAQGNYKDWAQFYRYAAANAEVKDCPRAVFIGDSITDSWLSNDGKFFSDNNFAGRGISGQTTSHMLVRFRRDVIDLSPKYVVILAGTNDIAKNNGDIALENILGNIISMCELAEAHKIKPIICSVLPASGFGWRPELQPAEDILKLNNMLKEYAKSARIEYVDYHSAMKDEQNGLPESYAYDGVHPTLEGYRIMEEIILQYL